MPCGKFNINLFWGALFDEGLHRCGSPQTTSGHQLGAVFVNWIEMLCANEGRKFADTIYGPADCNTTATAADKREHSFFNVGWIVLCSHAVSFTIRFCNCKLFINEVPIPVIQRNCSHSALTASARAKSIRSLRS